MGDSRQAGFEVVVRTVAEASRFIAAQPGGPERLLGRHQPDERGLCRGCTTPGTGTPQKRWPCSPAVLAQAAAQERQR